VDDGLTDTRGACGRFGAQRLEDVVRDAAAKPADAIAASIDDALVAFEAGEQGDDVALLVMQAFNESRAQATSAVVGEAA
jgi:serine phosphatase RsbU (regulator of sigma subunit)